jgi:hypothetical protein
MTLLPVSLKKTVSQCRSRSAICASLTAPRGRRRKDCIAVALARLSQVVETLHTRPISVRELDAGRLLSSEAGQLSYFLRTAAASKVSFAPAWNMTTVTPKSSNACT